MKEEKRRARDNNSAVVATDPRLHAQALAEFTTGEILNDQAYPWWKGLTKVQAIVPTEKDLEYIWQQQCLADMPAPTGSEFMLTWRCEGAPLFSMVYRGDEVADTTAAATKRQRERGEKNTILFSHFTQKCYFANATTQLHAEDPSPLLVQFLCNPDGSAGCIKVIDILSPSLLPSSSPRIRAAHLQNLSKEWSMTTTTTAAADGQPFTAKRSDRVGVMWCGDLTCHTLCNLLHLQNTTLQHTVAAAVLLTPDPYLQLHIPWKYVLENEKSLLCQPHATPPVPVWYRNLIPRPLNG